MARNQENLKGNFVCDICEKNFKYKRVLERHLITHKDDSKYWCRSCVKPFATLKEKDEHRLFKHSKVKKKICRICSNTDFKTEEEYLWHIKDKHEGKLTDYYMCSDCGKQFKTKSELTQHINSKCGTIKNYNCKVCGQKLMTSGSLHNHMLRHKGERSYMCRFCAKLFLTAGQLKVHERIHTQEKAFVCTVCGKGFCHRQSLITHSTIHTGIKPFQCDNCGNAFSCIGNLIKHRRTHADTCGLLPLTTHRVKDPSTKLKLKINTPSSSRLKMNHKEKELQEKLATLTLIKTDKSVPPDAPLSVVDKKNEISKKDDCLHLEHSKTVDVKSEIDSDSIKSNAETFSCNSLHTEKLDIDSDFDNEDVKNIICMEKPIQKEHSFESIEEETKFNPNEETEMNTKKEKNVEFVNIKTENDANTNKEENTKPILIFKERKHKKKVSKLINARRTFKQKMSCKFCDKPYNNIKWLLRHEKDHKEFKLEEKDINSVDVKSQLHNCNYCNISFNLKEELKEHRLKTHTDLLTCHDCDKVFANVDSLKSHKNIFHKGLPRKVYTYICEKCGKQFKHKANMAYHEQNNCAPGPLFPCNICLKKFSSVHTRRSHMRVHDPEKKLLCKFCGKSFHWKGQLKIHERSHTGEKPFSCLYCPKAFAYRESLLTHSSLHTGIKPHLCEACGSRFSCIGNLIKHRVTHAMTCGAWYSKNANN